MTKFSMPWDSLPQGISANLTLNDWIQHAMPSDCCTSLESQKSIGSDQVLSNPKGSYHLASIHDIKTLQDVITYYGNLNLTHFEITSSYDEIPTINLSCHLLNTYIVDSTTIIYNDEKENKTMETNSMSKMFNGLFGKIANGMCRLSMNGGIAVRTSNGDYKTYNVAKNRLVNCSNFVFDIGDDLFFVIPTNKVEPGDIILFSGKPKCVIKTEKGTITVINYEDSTIETVLPERHVFMGNTYFYGKIVSMFGDGMTLKTGKSMKSMMKYMMMAEAMKGRNGDGLSSMLPIMMLGGEGFGDIFGGFFEDEDDVENTAVEDEDNEG